jgi:putative tricarboxylic transport membrane protein
MLSCTGWVQPACANDDGTAGITGAGERLERLTLIVPAAPGGDWDLTARAMKQVLEGERIVRSVDIVRIPGDGGLTGLADFVSSRRGDGRSLLVGGMFMLGAAVSKHAVSSLDAAVPVAQLTADSDVVVVPAWRLLAASWVS